VVRRAVVEAVVASQPDVDWAAVFMAAVEVRRPDRACERDRDRDRERE
jgi:phage tail protein X